MTGLYDKNILVALINLMLQIQSAESYKLGLIPEGVYKLKLFEQREEIERLIKEVDNGT